MGYFIIFFIIIILFSFLGALCILLPRLSSIREKKKARRHFFFIAKGEGFKGRDAENLYKLALKTDPEDPLSFFWSREKLDLLILRFVRIVERSRGEENKANHEFLSRLYDYRKRIERGNKERNNALINTRQIPEYQELQVLVEGSGTFKARVLDNNDYYLTITRPAASGLLADFSWEDRHLSAYFWRNDDAGYLFYSSILSAVFFREMEALKINHSSTLYRTQKRESIRIKVHKQAYLYIILHEEDAQKLESSPGLKCIVKDLSEDGCAVAIGGRTNRELRVKIQFSLNDCPICMPGTVCSAKYNEETGRSLLHIKADPLPLETRNRILGEVFEMLPYEKPDLTAVPMEH
jgi:c-di-GMP-binding flagellar brake protein YcgR